MLKLNTKSCCINVAGLRTFLPAMLLWRCMAAAPSRLVTSVSNNFFAAFSPTLTLSLQPPQLQSYPPDNKVHVAFNEEFWYLEKKNNVKTKTRIIFFFQKLPINLQCFLLFFFENILITCTLQCASCSVLSKLRNQIVLLVLHFLFNFKNYKNCFAIYIESDFVSGCYEKWLWTYDKAGSG